MGYSFEWDPKKAASNLRDHGVSFDEATTVFGDLVALNMPDLDHSDGEQRFLVLGMSIAIQAHCGRVRRTAAQDANHQCSDRDADGKAGI